MGVDFKVTSVTNPQLFAADPMDAYVKWAWRGIDNWKAVMEFLGYDFTPIYEPADPYISESEVEGIRDSLKMIVNLDPTFLWGRMEEGKAILNDAAALLPYFEYYVLHKAHIERF